MLELVWLFAVALSLAAAAFGETAKKKRPKLGSDVVGTVRATATWFHRVSGRRLLRFHGSGGIFSGNGVRRFTGFPCLRAASHD